MRRRASRGQASVELIALVPVLVGIVILVWQLAVVVRGALLAQERVREAAHAPATHGIVHVNGGVRVPTLLPGIGELTISVLRARPCPMSDRPGEAGQALPLVILVGTLLSARVSPMFWLGRAHATQARAQTAADLTAISAARRLRELLPAMAVDPPHTREARRAEISRVATQIAGGNGVALLGVAWPEGSRWPPTTVQVTVEAAGPAGTRIRAAARAAVAPGAGGLPEAWSTGGAGQYTGPLVLRDGKPTCPAVAAAFDRMDDAAHRDGVDLVVNSAFRTDAEQAVLFRRHPDPRWVAPPGKSRHREATELDLGGSGGAWAWLAGHASGFGFRQRYSWEPWHYGYLPGCGGDAAVDLGRAPTAGSPGLPPWVPPAYRHMVVRGAASGGVPPIILAALLRAESGYDRWAVSPVGALGIAQFMPATARCYGASRPVRPHAAIGARPTCWRTICGPFRVGAPGARRLQRGPGAVAA